MGRILVADDDPAIRAMLRELLSDEGYEVVEASDGRSAVELALSLHPQVVLMDLRMPQLDGMEATREIKADPRGAGASDTPAALPDPADNQLSYADLRSAIDGLRGYVGLMLSVESSGRNQPEQLRLMTRERGRIQRVQEDLIERLQG